MTKETAHHELRTSYDAVEISSDRSFGLTFTAIFMLLAIYLRSHDKTWWPVAIVMSTGTLILALFWPHSLGQLNRAWAKVGILIGAVVAPIVMAAIYFAAITPLAAVARIAGKDFLRLRRNDAANTYWLAIPAKDATKDNLRDQF